MIAKTWRSLLLVGGETAMLSTAVLLGTYVRLRGDAWTLLAGPEGALRVGLIVVTCHVCLHYADLYDLRTISDTQDLLIRLFQALGSTSLILAVIYFWFPQWVIGRGVFVVAALFAISLVVGWRVVFRWLAKRAAPRERLLLVGTSPATVVLARELHERRAELGVDIVGFVDSDPARVGAPVLNPRVIGTVEDIESLVASAHVDRVVVSLSDARGRLPMDRLLDIRLKSAVQFDHLASVYEEYTGKIAVENLRPSWLIFSRGFRKTRPLLALKRLSDIALALIGLVLALPLMAAIAVAMKLTSRGPILYHQQRVGLNGAIFSVHKLRTMQVDAEAATGPVWSSRDDPRITPIGGLLRKTRIDEIPQLWNVLKGEMSFVGPRPERPEFVSDLAAKIPFYGQRHVVKPGLTGWAQVRYTYGASVEDAIEKLQYDLYYIKNLSFALDLVIMLETIKIVILRRGAR